jgi:hypothetical protein
MEFDTPGITEDPTGQSQEGNSSDANIDESILVANGNETEPGTTTEITDQQKLELDRMELIRKYQTNKAEVNNCLEHSTKENTKKNYNAQLELWVRWYWKKKYNPLAYEPHAVVEYLVSRQQYSYNHLNTIRSSITSVFRVIHKKKPVIASNTTVQEFFSAKRRINPQLPNANKKIYSIMPIFKMITA